ERGFALNRVILDACQRAGFAPAIAARSGQIDFIVALVMAGMGVAFLPRLKANEERHAGVARVPLRDPGTD
ncbi:LysR substrate-binding domain-containing protein, partial [Bifidobacterium longum]|uniref:LysR substrate-binding domain-containing protein n=2 Tax=Bacteria TaxID=2 RepID=UPI000529AC9B